MEVARTILQWEKINFVKTLRFDFNVVSGCDFWPHKKCVGSGGPVGVFGALNFFRNKMILIIWEWLFLLFSDPFVDDGSGVAEILIRLWAFYLSYFILNYKTTLFSQRVFFNFRAIITLATRLIPRNRRMTLIINAWENISNT